MPERATVEYAVLDLDSVKAGITLNESDLKTYYEQNAARLASKEERRASHILITSPKDAKPADRQAAKEKAQLEAQRNRAAQAKAKAVGVRGTPTVNGFAKPPDDLRGTLNAVWDGRVN